MLNGIVKILKKIILSSLIIYAYNMLSFPLNLLIPINIVTVLLVTMLGFPALLGLILLQFFL